MEVVTKVLIAFVAIEHLYILYIEMFVWETIGKRTFKTIPKELFKPTKVLAANQGLYNGFLSAGLIWSLFISDKIWSTNVSIFFLGCVMVAGIFGALTASKRIFFIQAVPGIITLVLVIINMG